MKRSSIKFIFAFVLLPILANSQDILTLEEAIRIGLENSFSIRIARNEVDIARNNNTIGNAGYLPLLDLNANQNNNFQDRYFEFDGDDSNSDKGYRTHTIASSAQLGWTLFDGFAMFIRKEKLDIYAQQSDLQLRISVENAIAKIVYTYYSIAFNENLYKSYKDQMGLSRERLAIAREKSNIGVGYELQELQSEVDYRADSARYMQQSNYLINIKAELNRVLARQPNVSFKVNTTIPVPKAELSTDIFLKVQEQNPNVLYARLQAKVSELEIDEAKASRYPTLNLAGAYNFSRTGTPNGQTQLSQIHGPSVGIGASVTLFNGHNINRRIKNAAIIAENRKISQEELELNLQSRAFQLVNDLNQSIELVLVEVESVKLAQRNAEAAWEKYQLGAISDIELRESQNKFLDAQTRLISAQMTSQAAAIEIKTLTGDLSSFIE
ncbi:MAG: TolC family protein [Bacteroidales bacterium]|jgi:outer membrane protein TolC|nr:TolC family protein [Bacteroidales bacterium]MDD4383566.1 TolC family protein [Bacteroidales bacterium]MDY0197309.1 TolC family protein [Tenuifilaceae bacterium]